MKLIPMILCVVLILTGNALAQNAAKKSGSSKTQADCSRADDATITARVKEKLGKAASLKEFNIEGATTAGVVTLTGVVKKGTQKGTASRIAKSVACVKGVDNKIVVEASPERVSKSKEPTSKKPKKSSGDM